LNPRPHGPEIQAVSSTETYFEGFEIDSRHRASDYTDFEPFRGRGLLDELLQAKASFMRHLLLGRSFDLRTSRRDISILGFHGFSEPLMNSSELYVRANYWIMSSEPLYSDKWYTASRLQISGCHQHCPASRN
jgi:hypothetical protein